MVAVDRVRERGGPSTRHLQRLPDSDGSRITSGRTASRTLNSHSTGVDQRSCRNRQNAIYIRSRSRNRLRLPIAHGQGRYFVTDQTALGTGSQRPDRLPLHRQPRPGARRLQPEWFDRAIAGVCNDRGNVVGLMPHPERAFDALIGGDEGLKILEFRR